MSAEMETNLFGGYDDIEYEGMDGLISLIDIIKGLDDQAYKFVMRSAMRKMVDT
jgi:hypothetical protein